MSNQIAELRGKYVRLGADGSIIMGSQKRPEWRPLRAACDVSGMTIGRYYAITVQDGAVTAWKALSDDMPAQYGGGGGSAGSGAPSAPSGVSMRDVMMCCTGIAKSLIESGTPAQEAYSLAMKWGHYWMPPRKRDTAPAPAPASVPEPAPAAAAAYDATADMEPW